MPAPSGLQISAEEVLACVQKQYWVGRFKIKVAQTQTHHDQRPLDESWVEELAQKIGEQANLNRALHPIGVVLETDEGIEELRAAALQSIDTVPELPESCRVLVYAGQHRLAVLPLLGLDSPEDKWWHADVYAHDLQVHHPAEFLTMMHESNVPLIMKASSDVDLFRAVVKLKGYLMAGTIDRRSFLLNRQALLGHDEWLARAVSNLTRNNVLAEAISSALTRPHIAKIFQAGAWKRLSTGRLWGVAAGLVHEMVCQVDLLAQGAVDIPLEAIKLPTRMCSITQLEAACGRKTKKKLHPWEALPGGLAEALRRVQQRPLDFVTPLNPKTVDGWSLPDIVLMPSCLGSQMVENELKSMQEVMLHLLRMCALPEHFNQYISASPESLQVDTDHPAGMIAYVLTHQRGDSLKVQGYEQKIIYFAWRNRKELLNALTENQVADARAAEASTYIGLLSNSRLWWQLLRLFKVSRLPFGFRLAIPKEFGNAEVGGPSTQQDEGEGLALGDAAVMTGSQRKRQATEPEGGEGCSKRACRYAGLDEEGGLADESDKGEGGSERHLEPRQLPSGHQLQTKKHPPKRWAMINSSDEMEEDEEDVTDGSPGPSNRNAAPLPVRLGGDRQLGRILAEVQELAYQLSRPESKALSSLLTCVTKSKQMGIMESMLGSLNKRAMQFLDRVERQEQAQYDSDGSPSEQPGLDPLMGEAAENLESSS